MFNYRDSKNEIMQHCPVMIENQDSRKFYYDYQPDLHELVFTLPKAKQPCPEKPYDMKSVADDIIWQVTVEVHKTDIQYVECHRGYFKLHEDKRTKLDFKETLDENQVAWIRIQGYDIKNPQKRAWFQAIKGPMFNQTKCKYFLNNYYLFSFGIRRITFECTKMILDLILEFTVYPFKKHVYLIFRILYFFQGQNNKANMNQTHH